MAPYHPGSNSAHPPAGAVSTDILPSRHRPSDTRARVHFAYNSYILHIAPGLHHRKSPRQLTDEDRFVWIRCPVSPEGFQNKGSLKVPRCCVQESTDGKRRHLYLPFLFLPPGCLNRQSLLNLRLLILSIPSSFLPCPFWSWLRTKQPSYSHLIAWRNDSSPSLPIGEARQHDQEPTAKSDFHLGQPHSVPFVLFVFSNFNFAGRQQWGRRHRQHLHPWLRHTPCSLTPIIRSVLTRPVIANSPSIITRTRPGRQVHPRL